MNLARRAAGRAGAGILGVTLALGIVELAVRIVLPQPYLAVTPGLTTPDPPGRYRLTPGYVGVYSNRVEYAVQVKVNQAGLRGPDLGDRDGAFRLLAIGDSFTFGTGVEADQVFVERAAAELRASGHSVVALNAGVPGFGPPDAVSWVERHGRTLNPDAVVFGIFLGNDLQDALHDRRVFVEAAPPSGWASDIRNWLDARSHAFVLLKRTVPLPLQRSVRGWLGRALPPEDRHLERELQALQPAHPVWMAAALAALDRSFERLVATRIPVVAVLIPSDLQLDPDRLAATAAHLGFHEPVDADQARRLFGRLLARHAIPYLDLTDAWRQRRDAGEPLYYRHDRHWTAQAHALAGREIARFLQARGLPASRLTPP